MKAIFNSLGSNYNKYFWIKTLFAFGSKKDGMKLRQLLENRYDGTPLLFYKGREAIFAALKLSKLPKGSKIAITGLTCYAVYRAIIDTGHTPVYVDIATGSLNFDGATLRSAINKHPDIKAIIIQNTLGFACYIDEIIAIAKQHNLIIIEDLAHCIGTKYDNGKEAGTVGDFAALSFSQDKVVDGVSGGALIIRNPEYLAGSNDLAITQLGNIQKIRDRLYPLLTGLVRLTYPIGLGKILHSLFKKTGLLARAVDGIYGVMRILPNWYCKNIVRQFAEIDEVLQHRKEIAKIYEKILPESICIKNTTTSTYLRFPIVISGPEKLWKYLNKSSIYITDTWYDVPVAPKRYFADSSYKTGMCPNSDELTTRIVNLPTHVNISHIKAAKLAQKVLLWLSK